jgi:type IV pilus assembly protein PilQ
MIDVPVEAATQLYADYDGEKNVKILFTPPVTDFVLPLNETALVSKVEKTMAGSQVAALNISLNSRSKFLLSRQSDGLGRLMLVSDDIPAPQLPTNVISSMNFKPKKDSLLIVTYSSLPFEVVPEGGDAFRLTFRKASFQEPLLKKYDVTKLGSAFDFVTAYNDGDGNAYLLFSGASNPALTVLRKGDETHILVKAGGASQAAAVAADQAAASVAGEPVYKESEIQELNTLFPGMKENYTGERISIDLQNASVEQTTSPGTSPSSSSTFPGTRHLTSCCCRRIWAWSSRATSCASPRPPSSRPNGTSCRRPVKRPSRPRRACRTWPRSRPNTCRSTTTPRVSSKARSRPC